MIGFCFCLHLLNKVSGAFLLDWPVAHSWHRGEDAEAGAADDEGVLVAYRGPALRHAHRRVRERHGHQRDARQQVAHVEEEKAPKNQKNIL